MDESFKKSALDYHQFPSPGKISVTPTKALSNQLDLSLAYSPGVAVACEAIHSNPLDVGKYTARSNLVGVITNGTAVLGLGNIGPLASKPVMEGKGCLFKKFAGIDVFDIELDETDADKLVDAIAMLEPTLGGVNLEDIKAPECFYIERKLRERMKIPVFHDDQHGTAIIASAAILNGLKVVGKSIEDIKLVCSGAGAAAIACLDLLVDLGVKRSNILVVDSKGGVHEGREGLDESKKKYAAVTHARSLADASVDADVFLGCSSAGVLKPEMVASMAREPMILALANPEPEIRPELAKAVRPDCIIATGRSDYPNQVNNVLCFPFIFRGALDVGATAITESMKLACVHAIAELAHIAPHGDEVAKAYAGQSLDFGPDHLIPKPFDPRLISVIAPAVAKAAMDAGVATKPIADLQAYRAKLVAGTYRSGVVMQPIFAQAKEGHARVVFAEGEDERVLRAAQLMVHEGLGTPVLVGTPEAIQRGLQKIGVSLASGHGIEIVSPYDDLYLADAIAIHSELEQERRISLAEGREDLQRLNTLIAALVLRKGRADGMICGLGSDNYRKALSWVEHVIGKKPETEVFGAINLLMLPDRHLFIGDTNVNDAPTAREIASVAGLAVKEIERFGMRPQVALLSNYDFGGASSNAADRMASARRIIHARMPHLKVEGSRVGNIASTPALDSNMPSHAILGAEANLLLMPNAETANMTCGLLKTLVGEGEVIGPILLGTARPVHILTPDATVRQILNMAALVAATSVASPDLRNEVRKTT